jgi:uncharacterized membrane protein
MGWLHLTRDEPRKIEAFSDGVFAIALTRPVLGIQTPSLQRPLGSELVRMWPSFAAYGVSALLLVLIWANHPARPPIPGHASPGSQKKTLRNT